MANTSSKNIAERMAAYTWRVCYVYDNVAQRKMRRFPGEALTLAQEVVGWAAGLFQSQGKIGNAWVEFKTEAGWSQMATVALVDGKAVVTLTTNDWCYRWGLTVGGDTFYFPSKATALAAMDAFKPHADLSCSTIAVFGHHHADYHTTIKVACYPTVG